MKFSNTFPAYNLSIVLKENWNLVTFEGLKRNDKKVKNLLCNVMCCTIWYHLYNLKNVKNTHGSVLLLAKLQAKRLQLYLL